MLAHVASKARVPAVALAPALNDAAPPLSFAQRALWLLDQLHPDSSAYNVPVAVRLDGPLDVAALTRALQQVVARHGALRTTIAAPAAQPHQRIAADLDLPLRTSDLSGLPTSDAKRHARDLIDDWAQEPFDLAAEPLIRARLVKLAADRHVLLIVMHHVVCDGPSIHLMFDELAAGYAGTELAPLARQYADYARSQHSEPVARAELDWWRDYLAGAPTTLTLPVDKARPAVQGTAGATHVFPIPAGTASRLGLVARRLRSSPFMVAMAAYAALLGRVCGTEDVLVGTPVGGRSEPELEPLIGFFVNTLPVRVDLSGDPTFAEVVRRVRTSIFAVLEHQDVPFELLVDALKLDRSPSHTPLVQTVFTYEPRPMVEPKFAGLSAQALTLRASSAKFELDIMAVQAADGSGDLEVSVTYSTDLFEPATIDRLSAAFQRFLAAGVADPDTPVHSLPLQSAPERREMLDRWSVGGTARTSDAGIPGLFARQAERTPHAPAASSDEGLLTYAQLADRAGRLATRLRAHGVTADDVVGVLLPKGLDLTTALLGVLAAGAAYLPLDPTHPAGHLARVLATANASLVVTDSETAHRLDGTSAKPILVDRLDPALAAKLDLEVQPTQLAYVIFTSGSTGEPKGVGIPHSALVNHSLTMRDRMQLAPQDRVLQFARVGFDVAAEEIFPTWLAGGCVVLAPEPTPPPSALSDLLRSERITVANLPAGYWQHWVSGFARHHSPPTAALRLLLIGSENVDGGTLAAWRRATTVPVINAYGLTETTITAVMHDVTSAGRGAAVPIGRPIDGLEAYVLDAHLEPLPPGVPGELYLAGAGLARGYLGRPDLTAERFLPHPFSREPGARMHRTGDRARWLSDGTLQVLGRVDTQLKVRGYRIEPAEVEAALLAHPGVAHAAVAARAGADGERLVGYVVPRVGSTVPADLRAHLTARLPVHLVPTVIVGLDTLPTTASGKLDRAALPTPVPASSPVASAGADRADTELERQLAIIWQDVLRLPRVGVHDNFFDVGGTSLALASVHARLADLLGRRLPVVTLYEHPTIATLAGHLSAGRTSPKPASSADHTAAERRRAGRARLGRQRLQHR